MRKYIQDRVLSVAQHMIQLGKGDPDTVVRKVATEFDVSKSTIHKDMTERLPRVSPVLHAIVVEILEYNKSVRAIRGGEATRRMYMTIAK